jgi:hypothetical protein
VEILTVFQSFGSMKIHIGNNIYAAFFGDDFFLTGKQNNRQKNDGKYNVFIHDRRY